ncbi:Transposase DDE domain protein [uncultured archaeon]|nr:Transposase DDE domain protein [uncultured archaeon]
MDIREQKGKLIARTRTIKKLDDGFAVQSQNSKRFYFVDGNGVCNCPDCQTRGTKCKHGYAVQFFLQKITTAKNGAVVIQTKRLTYPQAWKAYNKSQETEKTRFLELLNDLIETPVETEQRGRGQPKISEHDLLFSSALKVYSQFSLRRFMSDLNEAKEKGFVEKKPCFASVGHFIQKESLAPQLKRLIQKSASVLKSVESKFSIDSTGFRTRHFSPYYQEKHGETKENRFMKLHAVIGCKTNIITACEVTEADGKGTGDCPFLQPLAIETANNGFEIKEFTADMAYSSRESTEAISKLGGTAYIPYRSNATGNSRGSLLWSKMFHYFQFNREKFMAHYHTRSNVESTFGALKAKFNDCLKSKTLMAQKNELLLKVLCFNIVQVIHETNELGVETNFNQRVA